MSWTGVPGATSYRIYRDLLNALAPDAYGQCLGSPATTQFIDPTAPPAGDGYFYLVTAVMAGTETPLGFTSDCMKRRNSAPCSMP